MNFRFIALYAWTTGVEAIKRGFSYTLGYMATPLALLFLFGIISGGALIPLAVIGGLVSITATGALYGLSDVAMNRIELKLQDLFVASSVTVLDYMLAISFSNIIFSLPGILVYIAIALFMHLFPAVWLIAIAPILVLLAVSISALALILASIPKHLRNVWGFLGILTVVFTFVPPLFYKYTVLPAPLLYIFMLSPVTSAAIMIQNMAELTPFLWYAPLVLIIETIVYFIIAKPLTQWRTK
jgi:ABC-2 type transport system permease protein